MPNDVKNDKIVLNGIGVNSISTPAPANEQSVNSFSRYCKLLFKNTPSVFEKAAQIAYDEPTPVPERQLGKNGDQVVQVIYGTLGAGYFTLFDKKLVESANIKDKVRQLFHEQLQSRLEDPYVQQSKEALRQIEMMRGQNNLQSLNNQPMPEAVIQHFIEQIDKHAELDAKARSEGKEEAHSNEHAKVDVECHNKLSEVFGEEGYRSGQALHKIGAYEAILKMNSRSAEETVDMGFGNITQKL